VGELAVCAQFSKPTAVRFAAAPGWPTSTLLKYRNAAAGNPVDEAIGALAEAAAGAAASSSAVSATRASWRGTHCTSSSASAWPPARWPTATCG
jgi:hypothetical protein